MRVRVLVPDVSAGGMSRAYALALVVDKLRHEVEIRGPAIQAAEIYPKPPPGLRVRPFRSLLREGLLASAGSAGGADVLLAVKPQPGSLGVALRQRSQSGAPIILDIDDWEPVGFGVGGRQAPSVADRARGLLRSARRLGDPNHSVYNRWIQRFVHRADAITAPTRVLAEKFGATLLPQARDTEVFDPSHFDAEACRRALGLEGFGVLLFPGTPRPHKGLEDVLRALERVGRPELRLVVAGGRETAFAKELAQREKRWLVELPRRPAHEMPAVVAAAHLVVVPQRDVPAARSQFPIKLTDAMAMAKPILTTRVGDVPEIVGDTAYLVAPSHPEQLAAAIEEIFANPAAAELQGERARKRCVERYSLEAVGRTLAPILEDVARRRNSARAR